MSSIVIDISTLARTLRTRAADTSADASPASLIVEDNGYYLAQKMYEGANYGAFKRLVANLDGTTLFENANPVFARE
jgi:hypothetical protein